MYIGIVLDDNESKVTPIKVANALIEALDACKEFPENGLKELVAYLSIHNRYSEERRNVCSGIGMRER